MGYNWKGRVFVDQGRITPEEYKTFFAVDEYGITFKDANRILSRNMLGDFSKIVPLTELKENTIKSISDAIKNYRWTEGVVVKAGEAICWKWNPTFTKDDGTKVELNDIESESLESILCQMIDEGCHWGNVK